MDFAHYQSPKLLGSSSPITIKHGVSLKHEWESGTDSWRLSDIPIGEVTRKAGSPVSAKVKFCHVNVSRWGNPPSRGRIILGDPGAVSPVRRKGRTKVFKYGRKSPWVPTLTELFPKIQPDACSWLGTKNALYYCAQSANSFSWVLFGSSYTTAIVSITACLAHAPKNLI